LIEAFIDGELSPDKVFEVEQHLEECRACCERVRFEGAVRTSLRRVVCSAEPSAAFQARVAAAMAGARPELPATETPLAYDTASRNGMLPWRGIMPLAAVAALALAWAARSDKEQARDDHELPSSPGPVHAAELARADSPSSITVANIDELLEEFVDRHAQAAATPEITEPSQLTKLEPEVGVPVSVPSLQQYGARWEGAAVVPVRNLHAASLRYRLGGHRVTLYVYNSARFPLRAMLEPRVLRDEPIYVGMRRGYSIAAKERRGVGYAVTADLDDRESAELVASIH
jgi:anti-sigma factor RsiW